MSVDLEYADRSRTGWYPAWTSARGPHPAGDPVVRNSGGGERPRITGNGMPPLDVFVVHYVGAGTNWSDTGDTAAELRGIERNHAIPSNKPNEYNSASDSEAVTWGYAGPFRAAHASGVNTTRWGHLVVIGLEDHNAVETKLVEGVVRMRRQLVAAGFLSRTHRVEPHLAQPDASTTCPGGLWTDRDAWDAIAAPLVYPTPPTPPPGDAMRVRYFHAHPQDPAVCLYAPELGLAWCVPPGPAGGVEAIAAIGRLGFVENTPAMADVLPVEDRRGFVLLTGDPDYRTGPPDDNPDNHVLASQFLNG